MLVIPYFDFDRLGLISEWAGVYELKLFIRSLIHYRDPYFLQLYSVHSKPDEGTENYV